MDNTDLLIIDELSKNSRITMKELGEKIHLTGPATSARVAKLEDSGVIEGYTIKVNHIKLGFTIHAMIHIYAKSAYHDPYLTFIKSQDLYVVNNYKISGESCYILDCRFPSNEQLEEFLKGLSNHVNYKISIVINK